MVAHLFPERISEIHRHDLVAGAASAHLRRHVDRERRRARWATFIGWLGPRLGRPVPFRTARPQVPRTVRTTLDIP